MSVIAKSFFFIYPVDSRPGWHRCLHGGEAKQSGAVVTGSDSVSVNCADTLSGLQRVLSHCAKPDVLTGTEDTLLSRRM